MDILESSKNEDPGFLLNPADQYLLAHLEKIDQITAILYYGRSGSVFLQSLLDNHPQILMMPGTYLMHYYEFWDQFGHLPPPQLLAQFCEYFAPFFDMYADARLGSWKQPAVHLGFTQLGEDRNEKLSADKIKFIKIMTLILNSNSQNKVERKLFFQSIHIAYTITINRSAQLDFSQLPIIVYQLHTNHIDRIKKLYADFPRTKFIHSIREPLQTLGSHFKCHHFDSSTLDGSYYHGFPPLAETCSRSIKLEDLHTQPKHILEKLMQWMGLKWADSLLNSTFDGKKWWNIQDVEQVSGFNKIIISKNHNNFYYKIDRYRLHTLYHKRFHLWRYSGKKISKLRCLTLLPLLIFPFKIEMISWQKELSLNGIRKSFRSILINWINRRRLLLKAWIYSLSSITKEIKLL